MRDLLKKLSLRSDAIISGLAVSLVGVVILLSSYALNYGHLASIGPGFFPRVIGVMMIVTAMLIMVFDRSPTEIDEESQYAVDWRALFYISLSIVAFIVLNRETGLLPAVFATIIISSLASKVITWRTRFVIAILGAVAACLLFINVLSLQFAVFRGIF